MKDKAYAKINLSLDILSRREDGYHELNSIMVPINLYDEIEIEKSERMLYYSNINIPFDSRNTIVKAIEYIKKTYCIADNFKVNLIKNTPAQAGLGGGSSDAASVLRILNEMYRLEMNEEEVRKACLSIGADVFFTYYNKPAVVTGIGEKLDFFEIKKQRYVLLVKPEAGISTKDSYENLNLSACNHPDISFIKEAMMNGASYDWMLGNSLEEPSLRLCPLIVKLKGELQKMGYKYPLMSGSGSTVFVLSDSKEKLMETGREMKKKYPFVCLTKFLI